MKTTNAGKLLVLVLVLVLAGCGDELPEARVLPVCQPPTMDIPGKCVRMHPCVPGDPIQTWCLSPGDVDAGTVAPPVQEAGEADAGREDAGEADAGTVEADAGTVDAGPPSPFVRITSGRFPGYVGAVATLTWESSGVEAVRVERTRDHGKTWQPLPGAESLPATDGAFTYTVPRGQRWEDVPLDWRTPSAARVRVSSVEAPSIRAEVEADTGCALPTMTEVQWPEVDGRGGFVELVNTWSVPINLDGFLLTADTYRHTGPAPFPAGTVIPARSVLVLYDSASTPPAVPAGVVLVAATTPTVAPLGMFALDAVCSFWSLWASSNNMPAFDPRLTSDEQRAAYKGPGVAVHRAWKVDGAYVVHPVMYGEAWTWTAAIAGLTSTPGARADGTPYVFTP